MRRFPAALGWTILSALGMSCGNAPAADSLSPTSQESPPLKVGVALPGAPIKVGVAIDKTGSSQPNGVAPVAMQDFEPLIRVLRAGGGEVGVGFIRETSNRPLLRLRIDPPVQGHGNGPGSTNVYERIEANQQTERDLRQRKQLFASSVEAFSRQLGSLLTESPDAQKSAICEAVRRIDLFLSEEDAWAATAEKYALFVTDGEENVEAAPCEPLSAQATVLLVRGGKPGLAFDRMPAKSFESLSAALAWITARRGNQP